MKMHWPTINIFSAIDVSTDFGSLILKNAVGFSLSGLVLLL